MNKLKSTCFHTFNTILTCKKLFLKSQTDVDIEAVEKMGAKLLLATGFRKSPKLDETIDEKRENMVPYT